MGIPTFSMIECPSAGRQNPLGSRLFLIHLIQSYPQLRESCLLVNTGLCGGQKENP